VFIVGLVLVAVVFLTCSYVVSSAKSMQEQWTE
jgi:hypothetical protein